MRKPFDAKDWFWFVGGDTTKVYSSKIGDYMPVTDPAYAAWKASPPGFQTEATPIDTEEHLGQVLAPHLVRPIPPVILDAYKEAQASSLTPIDVLPQIIFMMENQIRALQGNPPLTFAQFRSFVKGLM